MLLAGLLLALALLAPGVAGAGAAVDAARVAGADAEPGSWLAHGRTWDEQRHSPLAKITAGNVAQRRLLPSSRGARLLAIAARDPGDRERATGIDSLSRILPAGSRLDARWVRSVEGILVAPRQPHREPPLRPSSDLLRRYRFEHPVQVTRPTLPPLDAYRQKLEGIWETSWLTNDGALCRELEGRLEEHLGARHVLLCCNGTVGLVLALQACGIDGGEVVTTPFTFPATPHALHWNRVRPAFCDIEERTFNLDLDRLEERIGPETRAILPVHVFGNPCDVDAIDTIARRHGLPVIYDAAHALGVRLRGRSILEWGQFSVLSFHATKLFTTAEGGAVVARTEGHGERVRFLRNFGIADEETVIGPGINGKLSELHAALGLLELDLLAGEIAARAALTAAYRERLRDVPGLTCQEDRADVEHNYGYFPVLVDGETYGFDRDSLQDLLRQFNVYPRKYFHPLASRYPPYDSLPSAAAGELPVAERVAQRILCLPLFGTLQKEAVEGICAILSELHESA